MGILPHAATDIIATLFRCLRTIKDIPELLKMELVKEIGFTHMRIAEGLMSHLQLAGCVAKMCMLSKEFKEKGEVSDYPEYITMT